MKRSLQKYYMRAKRAPAIAVTTNAEGQSKNKIFSCAAREISEINFAVEPVSLPGCSEDNISNIESDSDTETLEPGSNTSNFDNCSEDIPASDNGTKKLLNVQLAEWAVKYRIPNVATNDLLKLLHDCVHEPLPLDARTLLQTVRSVEVKSMPPGHYYHFGLKPAIESIIHCVGHNFLKKEQEIIHLNVNIDGLPLTKSSNSQVYPILVSIVGENFVEMVGIYHGYEKPADSNEFLTDFVNDAINIINSGLEINNKHLKVKIKGIICDAPAKSFIKCIKGHTGYSSCTKCHITGTYIDRVCFPEIDKLRLRTDDQFRVKEDEDHHIGTTILEKIPQLDMINSFPLDYMHLVCLGVMKKLLYLLCYGKPTTKISYLKVSGISEALIGLAKSVPHEFSRKPRSLLELKRWKATEFRQILFYTGPVVLKRHLSQDRYVNFLSLHVAMTILCSPRHNSLLNYAAELLKYFVRTFQELYGIENTSHNIHNLLHLTHDVLHHGLVDNFSAFPYENFLQSILKSIRKSEKPLQQLVKRHSEKIVVDQGHETRKFPFFEHPHTDGPILQDHNLFEQFKAIVLPTFTLKIYPPDNCCCLKNNDIIVVTNIIKSNNCFSLVGRKYSRKISLYNYPCESSELNIFKTREHYLDPLEIFNGENVDYKCVRLNFEEDIIIIPLLHC